MTIPIDTATQGVASLLSSGGAFDTAIVGTVTAGQTQLEAVIASLSALPVPSLSGLSASLEPVVSGVGALATHVTDQISNLPSRLQTFASDLGLSQGTGDTPTFRDAIENAAAPESEQNPDASLSSICSGAQSFFGSIMGQAQAFMGQITSVIATINAQIQAVVTAIATGIQSTIDTVVGAAQTVINNAIGQAQAVIGQVQQMITSELQTLTDAARRLLNFSDAFSLRGLFDNPCVRSVVETVGTPSLVSALNTPRG